MQVDVTDEPSIVRLVKQVLEKFNTVDIVVNAQGINRKSPAVNIEVDAWDSIFVHQRQGCDIALQALRKDHWLKREKGKS